MTALLLNVAHALDHLVLLVFATAVGSIAADFGLERWEDLMPWTAGAFLMFGLGSMPAGRLGDLWGRRAMMVLFFFGLGASTLLVAATQDRWQMAAALTLMGAFASIYHPVGIPMLLQKTSTPGFTIGVNGLAGNLGIAAAAVSTGLLVQFAGWRAAFAVPGLALIACGIAFVAVTPRETEPPARRAPRMLELDSATRARVLLVMTLTAATGSILFNLTTNGNGELLKARLPQLMERPALAGALLAGAYALASLAQVLIGRLIDRVPMKRLMMGVLALQAPLFLLAAFSEGWALYLLMIAFMLVVFGAIPFTDAIVARFVDDRMRSRVSGVRLAVSFGVSSAAVWALGPLVKSAGFTALLVGMAAVSVCTTAIASLLPAEAPRAAR